MMRHHRIKVAPSGGDSRLGGVGRSAAFWPLGKPSLGLHSRSTSPASPATCIGELEYWTSWVKISHNISPIPKMSVTVKHFVEQE